MAVWHTGSFWQEGFKKRRGRARAWCLCHLKDKRDTDDLSCARSMCYVSSLSAYSMQRLDNGEVSGETTFVR